MDDDELEDIEELENIEPVSNSPMFQRRQMQGPNVPNTLARRNLNKNNNDESGNILAKKDKPSNSKSNKPVPKRLQKRNSNNGNTAADILKPKLPKKASLLPFTKKANNEDTVNSNTEHKENEKEKDSPAQLMKTSVKVLLKSKIIVVAITIGLIIAFGFIILFGFISIYGWIFDLVETFDNLGNDDYDSFLDSKSEYYYYALEYYQSLSKIVTKYERSCGVVLDANYIHGTLIYKYKNFSSYFGKTQGEVYQEMINGMDDVASLMISNCVVDYEIGGLFYTNLSQSEFLKEYYKNELEYMDSDQLTTEIFEYIDMALEFSRMLSDMYVYDNLQVKLRSCESTTDGWLNDGTSYPSTVSFSNYIMGTLYAEYEEAIKDENKEFLKAFTIVTTSYVLNRSEYKVGDTEIVARNGNCWQLSCDIEYGCYNVDGESGTTTFTGPDSDGGYYKGPMDDEQKRILSEVFEEVFGTVIRTSDGKIKWAAHKNSVNTRNCETDCFGQTEALNDSKNGMDYVSILNKYYDNITLSNMQEDSYAGDVSYDEGGYSGNVIFYKQTDYIERFCGKTSSTIASSGCGVTSMAIVLSTFVNRSYTPPVVMKDAYSMGYCGYGISGTNAGFFAKAAAKYNLGYYSVGKRGVLSNVTNSLESGNSLVIAHMGPGTFTRSGHYIVLSKVNSNGKVYVLDPNGGSKNGWYDFNLIVKELKGQFHILTRRG